MQMPKSLLVVCMAALGVSSLQAQNDSDLQLRAREELRRKIADLRTEQPSSSNAAAAASPTQAPRTAPAVAESAPVAPAQAAAPLDKEGQAREALRQKIAEIRAQQKDVELRAQGGRVVRSQPAETQPVASEVKPQPPVQVPAVDTKAEEAKGRAEEARIMEMNRQQAEAKAKLEATPVIDAKAEKARKKMEAKAQAEAEKQAKARAKRESAEQADANKYKTVELFSARPVEKGATPASNTTGSSGSKEVRLATLLEQYKADKITPAEYHSERAKILAEP
ncbi:MAG: hypothetical protein JWQ71_3875 [Pedosphaera sp.]|nr:hypothetical protein [Pedosphaera sp.]